MKTSSETLINDLVDRTNNAMNEVQHMMQLDISQLNRRNSSESWSALECIEHLNLYSKFYIPEFKKCIQTSKYPSEEIFTSGFVGNFSAESMLPGDKMKKMKTFKDKNPLGSSLNKNTIEAFLKNQEELLSLLEKARSVSLNKTKTATTLPLFRFKLGDTFRFVIYHTERHLIQAHKSLIQVNVSA